MRKSREVSRPLIASLVLVSSLIAGFLVHPTVTFANCPTGKIGLGKGMQGETYYGNHTSNRVIDADAPHLWVNSIYVDKDSFNSVEIGWAEKPNYGRQTFGVRVRGGAYEQQDFGQIAANSDHSFRLQSRVVPGGDIEWA